VASYPFGITLAMFAWQSGMAFTDLELYGERWFQ
jgi:hypothetical protein